MQCWIVMKYYEMLNIHRFKWISLSIKCYKKLIVSPNERMKEKCLHAVFTNIQMIMNIHLPKYNNVKFFIYYNCYLIQCISQQPSDQVINDTLKHSVLKLSVSFYIKYTTSSSNLKVFLYYTFTQTKSFSTKDFHF